MLIIKQIHLSTLHAKGILCIFEYYLPPPPHTHTLYFFIQKEHTFLFLIAFFSFQENLKSNKGNDLYNTLKN